MDGQAQHPDTDAEPAQAVPAEAVPAEADSTSTSAAASTDSPVIDADSTSGSAAGSAAAAATGQETPAGGGIRPRESPPLGGRMHYLLGGTLPPRYNDWVSHDLTGSGWRLRQALRPFVLMLPFAVVFALLPGQLSVRITIVVFLLLSGIGLGLATSGYFRNRRLEQHGFPPIFPPTE
ncbi:hypothetical protein Ga0074812_102467 [Parafrankia irregularis]|uniref:Uncharacterized protein n=1 Tax=Parafrankia irregularis TaxID=795642 RepID=A0A0S4QGS1_9ACTN|nr:MULTISPECIES: DUF5313 family protein [Parafrankia]MBE3202915.1 DUF5313 family protein [Parafrankia sp. CH37]CUU54457.1 hypothetical protein Ga0074812_102467 [Parafrankia irregularis]